MTKSLPLNPVQRQSLTELSAAHQKAQYDFNLYITATVQAAGEVPSGTVHFDGQQLSWDVPDQTEEGG